MHRCYKNSSNRILLRKLSRIFFLFLFCINNAIADVIKLDSKKLDECGAQESVITKQMLQVNTIDDTRFRQVLQNKQSLFNLVDQFFVTPNDRQDNPVERFWQMRGLCVFECDSACEVLVAKKRNIAIKRDGLMIPKVVCNNPGNSNGGKNYNILNLFNYSASIHTERQLNLGALYVMKDKEKAEEISNSGNVDVISGALIHRALKIPGSRKDLDTLKALIGAVYVYTSANPCQNVSHDNGGISCVSYYNALAEQLGSIQFYVYFDAKEMRLNANFISNNKLEIKLLHFIRERLLNSKGLQRRFIDCKGINWIFALSDDKSTLEIYKNKQDLSKECDFEFYVDNFKRDNQSTRCFKTLLTAINDILAVNNREQSCSVIADEEIIYLFNSIHNPTNMKNIHYYPI